MRLFFLFCIVGVIACKADVSNPEIKKLYDEVMLVHDEVMPETSTIHKLRKRLKNMEVQDSVRLSLIRQLENADENMMQWMADFAEFRKMDDEPVEKRKQYLERELLKIQGVSMQMKQSIADAENFINQTK